MALTLDGTAGITFNNSTTQASAGQVLQIVASTTSSYNNTTGSTFINTNLTASITPKFSTSRILVFVSQNGNRKSNNTSISFQLLRNSTVILGFEDIGGYTNNTNTNSFGSSCNYLDSPATTSSVTYSTQFCSNSAGNVVEVQAGTSSTITLMEIAP